MPGIRNLAKAAFLTTIGQANNNMVATKHVDSRRVSVAATPDQFERDGKPWFALSDTIWSAFANVPVADWSRYVETRARQGFGVLNISVLPILHDISGEAAGELEPFPGFLDGRPQFGALDGRYLRRAQDFLDVAIDYGLVPNLVLLWCNYAPDTWASQRDDRFVMSAEARRDYIASAVEAFAGYSPMWVTGGDADLVSQASRDAFAAVGRQLRDLVPEAVTTVHTQDTAQLPSDMVSDPDLSYYSFQSGHQVALAPNAWRYAAHYAETSPHRPVVNLEPCYEGHGHGFGQGRFRREDVRRASWQSVLSGASAGLGYGAHGVWGWHSRGATFNHADFSATPFDHDTALNFEGALDVVALSYLVNEFGLIGSRPRQDLVDQDDEGIRAALTQDHGRLAVYQPYATDVRLSPDIQIKGVTMVDLSTGRRSPGELARGGSNVILQPEWNSDSLITVDVSGVL